MSENGNSQLLFLKLHSTFFQDETSENVDTAFLKQFLRKPFLYIWILYKCGCPFSIPFRERSFGLTLYTNWRWLQCIRTRSSDRLLYLSHWDTLDTQIPWNLTWAVKSFTGGRSCDSTAWLTSTLPAPKPNVTSDAALTSDLQLLAATLRKSNHTYLRLQHLIRTSCGNQNKSGTILSTGCVPWIQTSARVHYLSVRRTFCPLWFSPISNFPFWFWW